MKTDKFDEILRKKIESIKPVFQETDWERFSAFAGIQTVSFWSSFWGKTLLYSVGTTTFIGLIAWNLTQFYAQKSLLQSVQSLTQQVDSLQRQAVVEVSKKSIPDTVYVTRYRPSVADVGSINQPNKKAVFETDDFSQLSDFPSKDVDNQIVIDGSDLNRPNKHLVVMPDEVDKEEGEKEADFVNKARKNNGSGGANSSLARRQKTVSSRKGNGNNGLETGDGKMSDGSLKSKMANSPSVGFTTENNSKEATTATPLELEMLPIMGFDSSSNLKKAKLKVRYRSAYYETPKSAFVFPKLSVRAGLGVDFGMEQFSPSAVIELFISNRFSISSGLRINYLKGKKYFTDEQFTQKNNRDFRGQYAPRVPPASEILNISERNRVVQIPIRLSYYQPLKNNFWLTASAGSDFDMYGSKRINFDFRQQRSEFDRGNYEANFPTVSFNNLVFSTGIEKRFNRFALQISPYWNVQINKVPYRRENGGSGFGGQFRVWVRF